MIGAIVLAAGRSTRMGRQKLLLPFGDRTIIGHVVDQIFAARAGIRPVVIVVSNAAGSGNAILEALAGRAISVAQNPDPLGEMLSSVRCGLQALPSECRGALIALGDQPSIRSTLVDELVAAFQESGKGIVLPMHNGKRGHPLIVDQRLFGEVLDSYDDVGLCGLLDAHPGDIHEYQSDDSSVLDDIDTPMDYERATRGVIN